MTDKPAFYVEVILGGYKDQPLEWRFPRLSWHCPGGFSTGGMYSTVAQRRKLLGRYGCHLVPPIGADHPLIQPPVEIPVDVARELLEAFTSGTVRNEAVQVLAAAIRDCR